MTASTTSNLRAGADAAEAHGIELSVCACKNADLARGSCNIAGTWPRWPDDRPSGRSPRAVQPMIAT